MSSLYPKLELLQQTFSSPYSQSKPSMTSKLSGRAPYEAQMDLYPAYSIADDTKNKAKQLSAEAKKEFDAAAAKAKSKSGHIELYSGQYYAACTFGGLLACVCASQKTTTGWLFY